MRAARILRRSSSYIRSGLSSDNNGHRFFDEGGGLVHETWEWFARDIHFNMPGSVAYAILDARLLEIADYQRAIRSEVPPVRAGSLAELAELTGINAGVSSPKPSPLDTRPASAMHLI